MSTTPTALVVADGTEFTITGLEWREDWEFDHPTVILSPVKRYSPNGDSPEQMVEELLIDAACDGKLLDHDDRQEFEWRGWSWTNLKRVYRRCFQGRVYPKKSYRAFSATVRFFAGEDGELEFALSELNYSN